MDKKGIKFIGSLVQPLCACFIVFLDSCALSAASGRPPNYPIRRVRSLETPGPSDSRALSKGCCLLKIYAVDVHWIALILGAPNDMFGGDPCFKNSDFENEQHHPKPPVFY